MAPLNLFPEQESHVQRLVELAFDQNPVIMDLSMLGAGKTYTASSLALRMKDMGYCDAGVIVITNVSTVSKWQQMKAKYGIPVLDVVSYAAIRGRKGSKSSNHGLLVRKDYTEEILVKKTGAVKTLARVSYDVTVKFKELASKGVLLILDEVQNIKNVGSDQAKACCALLWEIARGGLGGNSRGLLMSGSPIDKEEHTLSMVYALGILPPDMPLYKYNASYREYDFRGIKYVLDKYHVSGGDKIDGLEWDWDSLDGSGCHALLYKIFQTIIKPRLSTAMISACPKDVDGPVLNKYNGMFKLDDEEAMQQLSAAVGMLAEAVRYNPETGELAGNISFDADSMCNITQALMEIEQLKVDTFVRLARKDLESDPQRKVVLCFNYSKSIEIARKALSEYRPLIMTGSNSVGSRHEIIQRFQAADPTRDRLLIGNLTVLSTGIDLDDKRGGWPRTCLVSPMFGTITLYQLGHRFHRLDTHPTARTDMYMVYIQGVPEDNIIKALQRKGAIMKETVKEQAEAGVVFPCDYPEYIEIC